MSAGFKATTTPVADAGSGKTVPWPTGHHSGDYALLVDTKIDTSTMSAATLTTAAGFTLVGSVEDNSGGIFIRTTVWYNIATSGLMASPVVATGGVSNSSAATMYTYSGAANAAPDFFATSHGPGPGSGTTTNITVTGGTSSVANDLIVAIACQSANSATMSIASWANASLANVQEYCDTTSATATNLLCFGMAAGMLRAAGASGSVTATFTDSSSNSFSAWTGFQIALKPKATVSVTRDATSGKWWGSSEDEWSTLFHGDGIATPYTLWNCQDASGGTADSIGAFNGGIAAGSPVFQTAVTGWSRKSIVCRPATADLINTGGIPDASNFAVSWLNYPTTQPNGNPSSVLTFGNGFGSQAAMDTQALLTKIDVVTTGDVHTNGTASTQGVHLTMLGADKTAAQVIVQTDLETLTHATTASNSWGAFALGGNNVNYWLAAGVGAMGVALFSSFAPTSTIRSIIADRLNNGPPVVSVAVTPSSFTVGVTATQAMTATATRADGSTFDVTATATWASTDATKATVNSSGVVTGVATGSCTITATYTSLGAAAAVGSSACTVGGGAVLTSITVSPSSTSAPVGTAIVLTVTGHWSDSSTTNLTGSSAFVDANSHTSTLFGTAACNSVGVGFVTCTNSGFSAVATIVVTIPSTDENEHHPWPGIARGIWDHDGEQVVWTGDRILVARDGDYSLGSSAFWNRNTAGDLLKRGLPAYLPLQTDEIPAVTNSGNNTYVETCLTPTLRAVVNANTFSGNVTLDVFDRNTKALVRHRSFVAAAPLNPRIMLSGDRLICTYMDNTGGPLLMTAWTGDDWTAPLTIAASLVSYECAVAVDSVHFAWGVLESGIYNVRVGRLVGTAPASVPYSWGTICGGATANFGSIAIGVAPDNTIGIAFWGDSVLQAATYTADLTTQVFNQNLDNSFDGFGGLSICSRGLKNVKGEYEWLVHYKQLTTTSPACIRSFLPISATQSSVLEKRYNTYFLSKSFRVGDEVFIWAFDKNASSAYLLGGHYQSQVCGFADREAAVIASEDGITSWLHQVRPDPLTSGDRTGPFTITDTGGAALSINGDAGAASLQSFALDGYVQFTVNNIGIGMMGLSTHDAGVTVGTIGFGIAFGAGLLQVNELGVNKGAAGTSATGDVLKVERINGVVRYYQNGTLLYTSAVTSTGPLIADSSFVQLGGSVKHVTLVDTGVPLSLTWQSTNCSVFSETSGYGPTHTGTAFTWARLFNTGQPYAHAGNVRIGNMEFLPPLSTAAYGSCTYVSGSHVRAWDGAVLGDAGFQSYPTIIGMVASSGGSMTAGIKHFRAYIVRYNNKGERFECGALTSDPITVTAGQKVSLTLQTVPSTNHSDCIIEIYTTEAGGTTFYFDGTVTNDLTASTVTYVSSMSDANLRNQEGDTHATGVGQPAILETFGPLGCSVLTTSGDRLWGAGGQVPSGVVQFSTLHTDGSAAGFDDIGGTQEVDTEGGTITSICRAGDSTVAWEASKLFVISGVGPDNYGNGSFSIPEIVLADGATTHQGTVLTPMGPVYWGEGGPRLLTTGYTGVNISMPVRELTSTMTPSGVRLDVERQEVAWYSAGGDAVLWNFLGGQSRWARWNRLDVAAASPSALAMTNGRLFYPSADAMGDGGEEYQFKLRTGLVHASMLLGGGTKIRSTGITGEYKGSHTVRARFYFDGSPCWTEEWTWTPDVGTYLESCTDLGTLTPAAIDALGLSNKAGSYITHTRTRQNECAYLQMEVDDQGASGPTFIPTEITLEIGVSPALAHISPHPAS